MHAFMAFAIDDASRRMTPSADAPCESKRGQPVSFFIREARLTVAHETIRIPFRKKSQNACESCADAKPHALFSWHPPLTLSLRARHKLV
ncbi:hypothetical protein [Lysobacter hankyongensis]|uniref:hypothetical protein n=1 Tax=Lysobacter hankyongensis TaxID=1176535 RepID=UPI0031F19BC2